MAYHINSSIQPSRTDTTGAQPRQSTDGSLFIKDGDDYHVTSPDGGYVDLIMKHFLDHRTKATCSKSWE